MAKKYKLNSLDSLGNQSSVIRVDTMTYIPFDNDNTDYQTYLAWVADGNTPDPADYIPKNDGLLH